MNGKKKILVTGAGGFVGSAVIEELSKNDRFELYGLSRGQISSDFLQDGKSFAADIGDDSFVENFGFLDKADVVVHTAGLAHQFGKTKKEDFWKVNVLGTENVCCLASKLGAKNFVLISSVSVYGNHGNQAVDETFECRPEGFYGESKLESERKARDLCRKFGINLTIIRPSTVIGENDRGNVMRLITAVDRRRFFWVGDGRNRKSLIYKGDLAIGIRKVLENPEKSSADEQEVFNLTAKAVSMKTVVEAISKNLQKKILPLKISGSVLNSFFKFNRRTISLKFLKKIEKTFEKWLADDVYAGEKFEKKFDFRPEITIEEAISREVSVYRKNRTI